MYGYSQLDEVYLAYLCDSNQHAELRARGEDPGTPAAGVYPVDQPAIARPSRRDACWQ